VLKHHIPLKTDHWNVQVPGFTEIDLVAHSGNSAAGDGCYSLNLTDMHTGWTETQAVLGKSQEGLRQALEAICEALPFPLQGIDPDNGAEFINAHLYRYCQVRAIQFTPGRPYKKDDNAHPEQKNRRHVRRPLGYVRYDTEAARRAIDDLYRQELRLFQNLFQPSVMLQKKERIGSRLRRPTPSAWRNSVASARRSIRFRSRSPSPRSWKGFPVSARRRQPTLLRGTTGRQDRRRRQTAPRPPRGRRRGGPPMSRATSWAGSTRKEKDKSSK
jgi:hypothetical protein